MFDFIKKSLRNKLLVTFIGIGFLPFITLLIYTIFLSEAKIVNKIVVEQFDRTQVVMRLIRNHLDSLTKEVKFLSSLDLMDDLLAEDIDKRISRLLIQKYNDLNLDISLMAINMDSIIIASSKKEELFKKYKLNKLIKNDSGEFFENKRLYIYSKIYSSFDETKELGFLLLEYNLDNLDIYLTHQNSIHSYIVNPKNNLFIGDNISIKLDLLKDKDSVIKNDYLIVYKKFFSYLDDWYIVYAVDKSVALAFLYDFIRFMLYISVIIFVLIIYVSLKYSKDIVKPIEDLTSITDNITKTHNYSAQLKVNAKDEIAMLTYSFNDMLKTTSSALQDLEEENKLRLKRFIQLIEIFNTIIQTKTENECIDISIQQIKKLTNIDNLYFQKEEIEADNKDSIALYVTDFENDNKKYFGSIKLGIDNFTDNNEKKFYYSIAAMITLQLERIRLIEKTMSASKAKSAFISNMSHELRTPLNAIIGFAQYMIVYEELNDDQQDTVSNIESSAQYLLGMINEILDIAKIEAGKMEARLEDTDIISLVQSSYEMLKPLADDKDLKFEILTKNFKNDKYKTDTKMFKQIVINLLSNAIKFTETGYVKMELYNEDDNITVCITDTGIGISKEHIKGLFNDFTQVENVMQKQHKGTGLGLSLSRKMAKILGGNVILESQGLAKGTKSIFYIKT